MLAWATEPMYAEELIGTRLADLGIVGELTSRQRGRVFTYRRYVEELNVEMDRTE